MKLQKLFVIGILLVISVAAATAQNTLPNPNDDACWSNLDALRACSCGPTTLPRLRPALQFLSRISARTCGAAAESRESCGETRQKQGQPNNQPAPTGFEAACTC